MEMPLLPLLRSDYDSFAAEWYLGGAQAFSPEETVSALEALSRHWPERIERVVADRTRGAGIVIPLIQTGRVLAAIEGLTGAPAVVARMRSGERAANSEATVAWLLCSAGFDVELEPVLSGSVPDLAVTASSVRVLVEVVSPDPSDAERAAQELLGSAAAQLIGAADGCHLDVILDPDIDQQRVRELVDLAAEVMPGEPAVAFPELGSAVKREAQLPVQVVSQLPRPGGSMIFTSLARMGPTGVSAVTVGLPVSDDRAQRILSAELHHFPRTTPNVLVMDTTGVTAGMPEWKRQLERCFQPTRNRRIGGVLILHQGLSGTPLRPMFESTYLRNPFALLPIPLELETSFSKLPVYP